MTGKEAYRDLWIKIIIDKRSSGGTELGLNLLNVSYANAYFGKTKTILLSEYLRGNAENRDA